MSLGLSSPVRKEQIKDDICILQLLLGDDKQFMVSIYHGLQVAQQQTWVCW